MEQWVITLLGAGVGAIIAFASTLGAKLLEEKRLKNNSRKLLMLEIEYNYGLIKRKEDHEFLYSTAVFEKNCDKLHFFDSQLAKNIFEFYQNLKFYIELYRNLGTEYQKDEELKKNGLPEINHKVALDRILELHEKILSIGKIIIK
jgi:hypothetical protein